MEEPIRNALADKDYALAQSLADNWLSLAPDVAVAHYLAAWARDAQGLEADALVHYEKAFALGLSGENLRGALLGAGSTYRNLGKTVPPRMFGCSDAQATNRSIKSCIVPLVYHSATDPS
jgi:hypothetical protein